MKFITLLITIRKHIKEKTFLIRFNWLFKKSNKISVSNWYGGFGNNLIQIANSIIYSDYFKKKLYIPKHNLLNYSKINMLNSHKSFFSERGTFFYNQVDDSNYKEYYDSQINNIFKNKISQLIPFYENLNLNDDELVIHMRSMSNVENKYKYLEHREYIQNPLSYYMKIIKQFNRVTIVIENILSNPLIPILSKLDKVKIQSSSIVEDYNYLLNAKNLALSTNSTFAITAGLMSEKLEKIFYTSLQSKNFLVKSIDCKEKYEVLINNYINKDNDYDLKTVFNKLISDEVSVEIKNFITD